MIIYGIHPVLEALAAGPRRITRIHVTRGKSGARLQKVIDEARRQEIPLHFEAAEILARRAETTRHQGVVAELAEVKSLTLDELLARRPSWLLLLDGVEDPHNLGAVLRTAEAAGVEGVLIPERHSAGVTPAVVKTSAGAALHVPICRVGNVVQALRRLKEEGFWALALDQEGEPLAQQADRLRPLVVVVGGEHRGVRRLVRENSDLVVSLPMRGRVASLNLSVATGILLYLLIEPRR